MINVYGDITKDEFKDISELADRLKSKFCFELKNTKTVNEIIEFVSDYTQIPEHFIGHYIKGEFIYVEFLTEDGKVTITLE